MTNGWIDIKNTDMMLIMGGNPAENHPCGFKWAVEAKLKRNAKMIVVDPRFTRTASQADQFLQIRAGADIAFLGGLINYAIENNRVAKEYLVNYTNAAFIIKEGFKLPEDGLFSGFDQATKTYNKSSWNYQEGGNETGKVMPARQPRRRRKVTKRRPRSCRCPLARKARRVLHLHRRRFRRTSPTTCRCSVRVASINC
jgi:formate dehydrogenase major subunit